MGRKENRQVGEKPSRRQHCLLRPMLYVTRYANAILPQLRRENGFGRLKMDEYLKRETLLKYAESYCEYDGDVEVICGKCTHGNYFVISVVSID